MIRFMFKSDNLFPLYKDISGKVQPWIMGIMIYLSTLAIISGVTVNLMTKSWVGNLSNKITVEIPPSLEGSNEITPKQSKEILTILEQTKGVKKAEIISKDSLYSLLEPWLGKGSFPEELPIPTLIDVEIDKRYDVDLGKLSDKLTRVISGIRIQDHANWHSPVLKLAKSLQTFSIWLTFVILVSMIANVIFTTYNLLIAHKKTLDILLLIGAPVSYIANQFKFSMIKLAIVAAALSVIISILSMIYFYFMLDCTNLMVNWYAFVLIFLIPALMLLLIMQTTKFTVFWSINKDLKSKNH